VILVSDELRLALSELRKAHDFYQLCKKDPVTATYTLAMRDAREWIDDSVSKIVALLPPEVP
jgi:hypothetical protein